MYDIDNLPETIKAKRDHHVGRVTQLLEEIKGEKLAVEQCDKYLKTLQPKRVVSEETKAKMRAAHAARKASKL